MSFGIANDVGISANDCNV